MNQLVSFLFMHSVPKTTYIEDILNDPLLYQ